jgi:hypothetical protein
MRSRAFAVTVVIGVLALAASALAVTTVSGPSISTFSPATAQLGQTLTIKGKGFRAGRGKDVVVLESAQHHVIFLRAARAVRSRIKVALQACRLQRFLDTVKDRPHATRFRIRILADQLSRTAARGWLTITPPIATAARSAVAVAPCTMELRPIALLSTRPPS